MEKVIEYVLFFFFYSIIGWISEVIYCYIKDKKFTNRGFLFGPICPIYGTGALSMLLALTWCKDIRIGKLFIGPLLVLVIGVVVCDIVEYLTSYLMEKLFHARWWDYSKKKYNLHGRICLEHSCYWGIFSVLLIYLIHPFGAAKLALLIPYEWKLGLMCAALALFLIDLGRAVKNAIDVKKFSDKFKAIKEKVSSYTLKFTENIKDDFYTLVKDLKAQITGEKTDKKGKSRTNRMFKNNPNIIENLKEQIEKIEKIISEKFR
ncbi:MAG: putative ABC transporter permease [Clostridia bacterium]|nr:putative ABC transporter permease [Clostridia bacterium]